MFRDLLGLIRHPCGALRVIDYERSPRQGLLALSLSILLPALVAELAALGPFRPPAELGSLPSLTGQGADLYARWTYQHRFQLPVLGLLLSLVLWAMAALVIHAIARAVGGRGSYAGFLKLVGYAALLGLLALPFGLLDALVRLAGNSRLEASSGQLAGLVAIAVFAWQNLVLVLAARQHYGITTPRAVGAVIGPVGGVAVLLLALVILVAIVFVLGQTV